MNRSSQEKTPSASEGAISEKQTPSSDPSSTPPAPTKRGFFSRKARAVDSKGAVTGGGSAAIAMADDVAEQNAEVARAEDGKEPTSTIKPVGLLALFRYSSRGERALMLAGLVASAAAGSAQVLMTLIFGKLTASFVRFGTITAGLAANPSNPDLLQELTAAQDELRHQAALDSLWLTLIGIGMLVTTYFYMGAWVYTGEKLSKRIRERYLQSVLRQDVAFFDTVGAGEVATRIQTDTHLIQEGTSEKVALAVSYIATFFTGFILAYVRSWRLSLALSAILPCIGVTGAIMSKFLVRFKTTQLKHVADSGSMAEEVISTIRTAQAFSTQTKLAVLFDKEVIAGSAVGYKQAFTLGCGLGIMFFVIYSAYALAFVFGGVLITEGRADAGVVVNVFLAILIGSFSLAMLNPEVQAITNARSAAAKLYQTIDRIPTIDSLSDEGLQPETCEGNISLRDVKFHYPSRPNVPILKGLTVDFPAGKTAALVGSSGSGKSTVVALVERFYDPTAGTVLLDGRDIKTLNVRWLRRQIGLVSQEPVLFKTTVFRNIAYGLIGTAFEHAPHEQQLDLVRAAAVKANADGFISTLPNGYETDVGERGMLLSGGQKQRVAIARAIVSDPKILLLDEATSALDTMSEGVVQDALDKASAGRTTITIAHRLSTIKDAHKILVMGGGEVLESGSHNELLNSPDGAYARLVLAQKLAAANEKEAAFVEDGSSDDHGTLQATTPDGKLERAPSMHEKGPLERTHTGGASLSSQILAQRQVRNERNDSVIPYRVLAGRLGRINRDHWKYYLYGFVTSILSGCVYPAFGILYGRAISNFSIEDPALLRDKSYRSGLWFFIMAILSSITVAIQNYCLTHTAESLTAKLRSLSFRAILRSDIAWFDEERNSTGALTSSLSENAQKISGLAGTTLGTIIQSCATIVSGAIIGLIYGWKLSLIGIACIPLIVSAGYIRLRLVVLKDQNNKADHEESAQLACEAAGAIKTVASLNREADACAVYSASLDLPLQKAKKTLIYSNFLYALSQSMSFWVISLVFYVGSRWIADGTYNINSFFVVLMSVVFGAIQAGNVFTFVPDVSQAQSAATSVLHLLDQVPEIDALSDEGKKLERDEVRGHIRFENVHFRYPSRPGVRVLRNLNLEIQPGSYVALVGASGCGKSTTIQLIERFYDPLTGSVTLDGVPISDLNINSYRSQVALVSQEPTLYAGSVRFNILLGANKAEDEVTQAELEAACRSANILEFIESLPDGFETAVGGKGAQLSGGQKQRIAIARALIRNPKVLLLDEATSALDSSSEKVVQAALDNAAKGRTTIAIAHRLSTIQHADAIYFFRDGKVAGAGTHQELLALNGGYAELVNMQQLSRNA